MVCENCKYSTTKGDELYCSFSWNEPKNYRVKAIIGFLIMIIGFVMVAYGLWFPIMEPMKFFYGVIVGGIGIILIFIPGMILFFMGLLETQKYEEEKIEDKLKYGLG